VRIALNLLYLIPGVVGGTETYARSLIKSLASLDDVNEYTVYVNKFATDLEMTPAQNFSQVVCPFDPLRRMVRYGWEQGILPFQIGRNKFDLVHSLGYVAPLAARPRQVVTVHDVNFLSHDGWGTPQTRRILRFFVERSVRRAERVITVSEFSRLELIRRLGLPPEKVIVTLQAGRERADSALADPTYDPADGKPYILAFSALPKHKNIARLVAAFERIQERVPHSLVVVGHLPGDAQDREHLQAKAGPRIHFTGYLSDARIATALQRASLFAFPSLYEGFGIPLIEAQRAGIPVTCSAIAAIPEAAGKGAHYFDPHSTESMADALVQCLLDAEMRAALIAKGYDNAARFSWEKTARETLAIYTATADRKVRPAA